MTKDEMKNRISLALKDPILQQGFEIICKNLEEEKKLNAEIKARFVKCNTCTDEMKQKCLMFTENLCEGERCEELVDLMGLINKSELQKEIAELKEKMNANDILIKELQEQKLYWKESSFDWRHKFFKLNKVKRLIKKDKQLTKAKEIIREYSKWECEYCDYKRNPDYVATHCSQCQKYLLHKKAEQFISEVEK